MKTNYRISDLILDSLKCVLLHLGAFGVGFIVYAASVGHIMADKHAEIESKHSALLLYAGSMVALLLIILCVRAKRDVGRRTHLIEASRADDFDSNAYFKNMLNQKVLPILIGGIVAQLPYTIFYTCYGWDYLFPSIVDRFYASSMFFFGIFGGILGTLLHNITISGAYALYLYKIQKEELADRMWLKDAPKQEIVELKKPKDNYKNY